MTTKLTAEQIKWIKAGKTLAQRMARATMMHEHNTRLAASKAGK